MSEPSPYCPSCETLMVPGWGAWMCISRACVEYTQPKTRADIEREYERRWNDAQRRDFHRYHSY